MSWQQNIHILSLKRIKSNSFCMYYQLIPKSFYFFKLSFIVFDIYTKIRKCIRKLKIIIRSDDLKASSWKKMYRILFNLCSVEFIFISRVHKFKSTVLYYHSILRCTRQQQSSLKIIMQSDFIRIFWNIPLEKAIMSLVNYIFVQYNELYFFSPTLMIKCLHGTEL